MIQDDQQLPEVHENEDSKEESDDGDSIAEEEDEDLPLLDHVSLYVKRMVKTSRVVGVVLPGAVTVAVLADIVYKNQELESELGNVGQHRAP